VKYYYTVRELTNWAPELFAARAFGSELIARLVKNAGCDGIYLDDISYDRTVMMRARKILDRSPAIKSRGGGGRHIYFNTEVNKGSTDQHKGNLCAPL
jgi:hypothetical protein